MGYTVPVTAVQDGTKITVGFADIESLFDPIKVTLLPDVAKNLFPDQYTTAVSIFSDKDLPDVEEISLVVHQEPNNKEEQ